MAGDDGDSALIPVGGRARRPAAIETSQSRIGMFHSAEDWDVVMRAPLFKAMGPAISHTMIGDRSAARLWPGGVFFARGDPARGFFCVLEGWTKLCRLREDGEEVVVAIFAAGETFAEVAMFLGGRYPASAEAVTPSRVLEIDAVNLRRAVLAEPQLAFDMLAAASLRLRPARRRDRALEGPLGVAAHRRLFRRPSAPASCGPARLELPYEKALIARAPRHEARELFARAGAARRVRRGRRSRQHFDPGRRPPRRLRRGAGVSPASGANPTPGGGAGITRVDG